MGYAGMRERKRVLGTLCWVLLKSEALFFTERAELLFLSLKFPIAEYELHWVVHLFQKKFRIGLSAHTHQQFLVLFISEILTPFRFIP